MPHLASVRRLFGRVLALFLGLALAGGLGGCSSTVEAAPTRPAEMQQPWPGCEATGAFQETDSFAGPPGQGSIPNAFQATTAVLCQTDDRTNADDELVLVGLERRATDITSLLTYLAQPSRVSTRPDDLVCQTMAVSLPWLFLLDAQGRWVTPALPTDECNFPLGTFDADGPTYGRLAYHDAVVTQLRVTESAEARAAGCAMQWKNMVQVETSDGAVTGETIRTDPFGGSEVGVCLYDVPDEEASADSPTGEFRAGRKLDQEMSKDVVAALIGSKAAPADCSKRASGFAVLRSSRGEPTVYVELDGCQRILTDGGQGPTLAQASPTLVRTITRT
ncbi:MAG TPA: hypothetical protein VIT20_05150 [Propionibacteriaceae bacterium]